MKRPRYLWGPLGASLVAHGVLAWNLSTVPPRPAQKPHRDVFEVRMVTLPPPPPLPPEPPLLPPPPRIKPPPPPPKPTVTPPAPLPAPAEPPAEPEPPSAVTAPPAMLADGPPASAGGVVQQPFATVSSFASTSGASRHGTALARATAAPDRSLGLAKLSDLSRKPRAPSLDDSLRQHYPADLRRRGVEGQAEVRVIVNARGRVEEVSVVSESAVGFALACKNTLLGSQWSEPLDRDGRPVNTRLTYRCRFQVGR